MSRDKATSSRSFWNLFQGSTNLLTKAPASRHRSLRYESLEDRQLFALWTDPSFGRVTTSIGSGSEANAIAIQSDGKVVVAGFSNNGSNDDFALVRYNSDGGLDSTFGTYGKVTTQIGSGNEQVNAMAIQSNGKIIVTGFSSNGSNNDFALARYNSDGSLDPTFGSLGKVTTPIGSGHDSANSIAIQSDGKVVVAGVANINGSAAFAIARYHSDGSLDTSFSGDGILTSKISSSFDIANGLAIQNDGKLVVAGRGDDSFAVVRYNTNGSLDSSFGDGGVVTTQVGFGSAASSLAIQSDGKIVVAGTGGSGFFNESFALVRYNADGGLDTTFGGGDGIVTTAIGNDVDNANALAIQSDGKILVAGQTYGFDYAFAVVRYNSDGSLDTTFDGDGKATTIFGTNGIAKSIAIQSDGKLVVAGNASNGSNYDFAVVRYFETTPVITSFSYSDRVNEGERVYLHGLATDPNEILTSSNYSWRVTGPNGFVYTSTGRNDSFVPPDNGNYRITFTALDSEGLSAQATGRVLVANLPPQIASFVVPTSGRANRTVRLVGRATDPAGSNDALVYTWIIIGPKGYRKQLVGSTVNWKAPPNVGRYVARLIVTDGDGGRAVRISAIKIRK